MDKELSDQAGTDKWRWIHHSKTGLLKENGFCMFLSDPLIALLSTMSLTVALAGVLISLTQTRDKALFRVLACFFVAIALTELGDALVPVFIAPSVHVVLRACWIIGVASATPLLWLYIWKLTETNRAWPRRLWLHGVIPGAALCIFVSVFLLPSQDQMILLTDTDGELSRHAFIIGAAFELFALFIVTAQWGLYLVLAMRRLIRYRARLKDVFASTEGKELRWVAALIAICGAYWVLLLVTIALDASGVAPGFPEAPDYVLNLIVDCMLVIWGLRQRPGLQRPVEDGVTEPASKYAKSALTTEMATRIGAKLRRAMRDDSLHLNPNLSLWALSKHVGVSDNYVSQVLNEEIGENFFDFVNSYRVKEAQKRLADSDDTILSIAYEVGFNSRSSFYTAFRKSTGQTPTEFRRQFVQSGAEGR